MYREHTCRNNRAEGFKMNEEIWYCGECGTQTTPEGCPECLEEERLLAMEEDLQWEDYRNSWEGVTEFFESRN